MPERENPCVIILLYLLTIELLIERALKALNRDFDNNDKYIRIMNLHSDIYESYNNLINQYEVMEQNTNIYSFQYRLIYSRIFSEFSDTPIKTMNDLYAMLICIENNVVSFLEEFFDSSSYISLKDFILKIILERRHIISEYEKNIA
jgi:hypothetical protein